MIKLLSLDEGMQRHGGNTLTSYPSFICIASVIDQLQFLIILKRDIIQLLSVPYLLEKLKYFVNIKEIKIDSNEGQKWMEIYLSSKIEAFFYMHPCIILCIWHGSKALRKF